MEKLKEDDESDWSELQGALHALGLALHDCSVAEQGLIERAMTDWEMIAPNHVQSLVDSLSAVARTKLRYMNSAGLKRKFNPEAYVEKINALEKKDKGI